MLNAIQKFYKPKETRYLTHSFHPYPNKLVPQVARTIIKEYTKENNTILDPFVGSGTTLIEANLLKRNSIGIDLNPLACLISKVKTTPLEINKLNDVTKKLLDDSHFNLKRNGSLRDFTDRINPDIPEFPKREYWFQKDALIGLSVLKELINKIEDVEIKDFCLVAFSSIIKECSNASSLYKLTKLEEPKRISKLDVTCKFREKINQMIESINTYNLKTNSNFIEIHQKDSRYLRDIDEADFVITNPPNFSLDFPRCFKIHFWWLNLDDIKKLDRMMIGTKKINGKLINLNIDCADNLINKIKEKNHCMGIALSKYYYDIRQVLTQMHRLLKEDKYCCINVSDCVLHGNPIRAPDTYIELAKQAGFKLDKRIKRIVPKKALVFASKDKIEELLVFKKT